VPLSCTECSYQAESVAVLANWPSLFLWQRDDFLWCHDLGVCNASVKKAAFDGIVVVARPHLRRLASENYDIAGTVAVELLHPPCAFKFEVGHQGEIARFEGRFFGHIHDSTLIVGRSSIARASRSFQGLHWLKRASIERWR
jgi:hypothetical protein